MSTRLCVVLVLVVLGAEDVHAQDQRSRESRTRRCAESVAVVQDSVLGMVERTQALRSLAYDCGDRVGASLLSEELRGLRSRTDIPTMDRLVNSILVGRHPLILEAALALVSDQEATIPGRVAAMRVFVEYGNTIYYTSLGTLMPDQRPGRIAIVCGFPAVTQHDTRHDMAPLPEGWSSTVERVLRLIEDDTEEPRGVREAAHCALLLMSTS